MSQRYHCRAATDDEIQILSIPVPLRRSGRAIRMLIPGTDPFATAKPDARLVRLSYLAPDITEAILDGRQPRNLTADKLLAHSRLPLGWHEQRTVLGFA